jgi:hypothetical protein
VIGLWVMMLGCITDYAPENKVIKLNSGESQTFEVTSDDSNASILWCLDRKEVASDVSQYTFTAEQNATGKPIFHRIKVKEDQTDCLRDHKSWRERWKKHRKKHRAKKIWIIVVLPDCGNSTFYRDADGDGYGDPNDSTTSSDSNAPNGYVDNSDDCNDRDAAIHPGATEVCVKVDNNCNGKVDEGDVCA